MFKKLVNEATLTFALCTDTPLLINSGSDAKIRPGYDMSPVVTLRDGKETVYIPGSSAKGVFRTRYEQLLTALGARKPCNVVDQADRKKCEIEKASGTEKYSKACPACRLFGNLSVGSRIRFADAYPPINGPEPKLGYRHGVGIDRITGAAHRGAKFDYQMVENGTFELNITLQNFALYQLRLILAVIEDIKAGLVTFGMGGTRGNGRMNLEGDVILTYKYYTGKVNRLTGYFMDDVGEEISVAESLFGSRYEIKGLDEIIRKICITDRAALESAIKNEDLRLEAA